MGYHRKRVGLIEAVRFEGVEFADGGHFSLMFDCVGDLPSWLRAALIDEHIFAVSLEPDYIFVKSGGGLREARVGDWVVYGEGVGISVVDNETLFRDYEEVLG